MANCTWDGRLREKQFGNPDFNLSFYSFHQHNFTFGDLILMNSSADLRPHLRSHSTGCWSHSNLFLWGCEELQTAVKMAVYTRSWVIFRAPVAWVTQDSIQANVYCDDPSWGEGGGMSTVQVGEWLNAEGRKTKLITNDFLRLINCWMHSFFWIQRQNEDIYCIIFEYTVGELFCSWLVMLEAAMLALVLISLFCYTVTPSGVDRGQQHTPLPPLHLPKPFQSCWGASPHLTNLGWCSGWMAGCGKGRAAVCADWADISSRVSLCIFHGDSAESVLLLRIRHGRTGCVFGRKSAVHAGRLEKKTQIVFHLLTSAPTSLRGRRTPSLAN